MRKGSVLVCYFFLTIVRNILACQNIEIVTRSSWGARYPKWVVGINTPVDHLFIGHTVTPECEKREDCSARMRAMQQTHMDINKWSDIGYNFVIGGDGGVYEGVGWNREGVHTLGWNSKSYGIAFVGDFTSKRPNDNMLRSARNLIICGMKLGYIAQDNQLHGARDGTCTESPGNFLYEIIKKWPRFKGGPLDGYKCL